MRTVLLLSLAAGLSASPLTFSMSGTFNSTQTFNSPYFAPNTTWSLTFLVDSTPIVTQFGTVPSPPYSYFGTNYTNGVYSVGGSNVPIDGNEVFFYTSQILDVCLDSGCVNQIALAGPQIYSGPNSSPTLSPGQYTGTSTQAAYFPPGQGVPVTNQNASVVVNVAAAVVPEPSTFGMAGLALLGLAPIVRRRLRS